MSKVKDVLSVCCVSILGDFNGDTQVFGFCVKNSSVCSLVIVSLVVDNVLNKERFRRKFILLNSLTDLHSWYSLLWEKYVIFLKKRFFFFLACFLLKKAFLNKRRRNTYRYRCCCRCFKDVRMGFSFLPKNSFFKKIWWNL